MVGDTTAAASDNVLVFSGCTKSVKQTLGFRRFRLVVVRVADDEVVVDDTDESESDIG
jgi:hypothetical protein